MGTYHNISKEHTCSIIQAALDNAHATQKRFNKALTSKAEEKRKKRRLRCVCVLASDYRWGTVMHEIPISIDPIQ
jgi:hypothetical protein